MLTLFNRSQVMGRSGMDLLKRPPESQPVWSVDPKVNPVGSRRIAEYIVANLASPVDATFIVLAEPPLTIHADFTIIPDTVINWPSTFNHMDTRDHDGPGVVSIPILLYYMLFTHDYFVHLSFAWDTEHKFRCDVAQQKILNGAACAFLNHVVPWLTDMIANSSYVDEALDCKRHDIQFVVSMGNQQLKAVYNDKVHTVLTECLVEPWHLTQTTPFFRAFEHVVDAAIVLIRPVVYSSDPADAQVTGARVSTKHKLKAPDYILDNATGLISCERDKTILLFLILFSDEIAFLRRWISASDEWKDLAGVPTAAVAELLDTLAAATHTPVQPPFYIESA
jgi:hypothetical protein